MDKQEMDVVMKAELDYNPEQKALSLREESMAVGLDFKQYSFGDFPDYYDHYVREFYPVYYPSYVVQKSTMEQAFKVMAKLIEKGYFKNLTVQKFMILINEISSVL